MQDETWERVAAAIGRQRRRIGELLFAAGVPVLDAELLILNAIEDVTEEEWTMTRSIDQRLLAAIEARCRSFAARLAELERRQPPRLPSATAGLHGLRGIRAPGAGRSRRRRR